MSPRRPPNPLHATLVLTQKLGRLPRPATALAIALAALALRAAAGPAWPGAPWLALWSLADWLLLEALPRRKLSYGPVQPTHLALLAGRWLGAWLALGAVAGPLGQGLAWGLQPALGALVAYALWVEPFRLGVSTVTLPDERAAPGARPLSILQISDLHVERLTRRERQLLGIVERLQPDLILLTGDYLNLSYIGEETAICEVRRFLQQLRARYGVYAVRGTPQVDPPAIMPALFAGLNIRVLEGERQELEIDGHRLRLVGVGCNRDPAGDAATLRATLAGAGDSPLCRSSEAAEWGYPGAGDGYYTILLYHMPDLMGPAAELGIDLYLAGHTHGGQLRLPFYGAIITGSYYRKRYEMGWYRQGRTRLCVARGVGLEGMGAPRARFLCPPEVVHIRLDGAR